MAYSWVIGDSLDAKLCLAFQILEYALMDAPGAPLKQALLDQKLGEDIYGMFETSLLQPYLSIIIKNMNEADRDQIVQIIRTELAKLAEGGLNHRTLEGVLNYYEFKSREGDFGRWPKGLMYGLQLMDSWLYDDSKPFVHLKFQAIYDELREGLSQNYFEGLIKQYMIDNTHCSLYLLCPSKGLAARKEQGPTADIKVRKALIEAVNVEEMVSSLYKYGEAQNASLPLPPGSWGYDASLESKVPGYDPEDAKKLLAEAGYGDGLTLDLYISDTEVRQNMAVLLQAYWAQVGVTLNIHASEWGTFSEVAMSNNADVYGMSWTWYPDPYFFLNKLFSTDEFGGIGNGQHYSNAKVDELLQKALEATDQADRADYYKQALALIVDDLPGLFYANENVIYGVNGRVHDFIQRADNTLRFVTTENNVWVTD